MMPVLSVTGLEKSFGALKVTDRVDLTVRKGEIHALIGPNGAGKTSLVSQIYGSLKPDQGTIFLNGDDITALPVTERVRRGIARSFQITSVLMTFSVIENAMITVFAREGQAFRFFAPAFDDPAIREEAETMLREIGLGDRLETAVASLSHGERRLLELALAMLMEPALILLDEPMAGAGVEESARMTSVIAGLRAHCGVLLIEHDMDAVFRLADRITVLVEGEVIASDTPAAISRNEAVQAAYLGASS
ncbi:MAG: ABC transporter ATP-binding protein [Candidatus Puniceispirillales bacterium]